MKIAEAMEIINENAHYEADVIWGTSTSESVGENYAKVTVLFTEVEKHIVANNNF
jgi:cell division protein FtsZ